MIRRTPAERSASAVSIRRILACEWVERMEVRSLLQAIQRLDGAAGNGLGQRQTGEMEFAVDQDTAGAAAPLAATELRRHVADQFAKRDEQVGATIDENGDIAAVVTKLQGSLGHTIYS